MAVVKNIATCEEGKENKIDSQPPLRRSPRKHAATPPSKEKPQTTEFNEFHDIEAVFKDDFDDVLSLMSNM